MHRVHHVQEAGADDVTRLLIALYSRPRRHTRIGRGSDDGGGLLLSLLPCDAGRDGTLLPAHLASCYVRSAGSLGAQDRRAEQVPD